jgi:hypothetical protein
MLVPLDMNIAKFTKNYPVLREPAIKCQRMSRLYVDDVNHVLFVNQGCDVQTKICRQWTGGVTYERSCALIRSFHDVLLLDGMPSKKFYVQCEEFRFT